MTTETYWIVRNDAGEHLAGWWGASETGTAVRHVVFDDPKHTEPHEATTRDEAEAFAVLSGGHVVEVTVTERRVGLRWENAGSDWYLFDGENIVGSVVTDWISYIDENGKESEPRLSGLRWALRGRNPKRVEAGDGAPDDVIDAAKAAAEAAVRATWGGGAA